MVKDWSTLEQTGNPSVDMVASCIFEHRKKNIPLKSIRLNSRAYDMFEDFVKRNKEDFTKGEKLQFDGVDIEKDFLLGAYIKCEYYPLSIKE